MKRRLQSTKHFPIYFAENITLLVMESKRFYQVQLHSIDDRPSPLPEATDAEMSVFVAIKLQKGYCKRGKLTDYWATNNQFHTRVYIIAMKRKRRLLIVRVLQLADINILVDMTDENSDRL